MHSPGAWSHRQLAAAINDLVSEYDLSHADIAAMAGSDRSQLSRWKSGEHRPSHEKISALVAGISRAYPCDDRARLIAAAIARFAGYPELAPQAPGARADSAGPPTDAVAAAAARLADDLADDLRRATAGMPADEAAAAIERVVAALRGMAVVHAQAERARWEGAQGGPAHSRR
jgi:transcriptional regulator with XRE-family HTH domain